MSMSTVTVLAAVSAALAGGGFAHSALNLRALRRPEPLPQPVTEKVAVFVPARNEEYRIGGLLRSLRGQEHLRSWTLVVGDDASGDRTAAVVVEATDGWDVARLVRFTDPEPPVGWLGKPWICHRLSEHAADATVLVFIDADVRLEPHAIASAVALMRAARLSVVCPYPRQIASTPLQRLVQPLLQWSWATTLPLRIAESSRQPSLTAGNGQFLVVDAAAYRASGGHAEVCGEVLEDIALVRAVKAAGGRGGIVDGSGTAVCRMYDNDRDLVDGYSKSLWSAFGSPIGATAVCTMLAATYVSPVLVLASWAATAGHTAAAAMPWAAASYLLGVANRAVVARRVGGRVVDSWAHPGSVLAFCWLVWVSFRRRRRGLLQWKGRVLT